MNNRFTVIEISQPCADHLTKFTILDKYAMQRLAAYGERFNTQLGFSYKTTTCKEMRKERSKPTSVAIKDTEKASILVTRQRQYVCVSIFHVCVNNMVKYIFMCRLHCKL